MECGPAPFFEALTEVVFRAARGLCLRQRPFGHLGSSVKYPREVFVGIMQRIVAALLFAVLLVSPIAPAFAIVQPQPAACHRAPLKEKTAEAPAMGAMHCHEMGGQAVPSAAGVAESPRNTIGKSQCCSDHDCCRRQDRAQWVQLTPAVSLERVANAIEHLSFQRESALFFHASRGRLGRAPPVESSRG